MAKHRKTTPKSSSGGATKADLKRRLEGAQSMNQSCSDCFQKKPQWVSLLKAKEGGKAMGVFCCYNCCSRHHRLGRDVCQVKNINEMEDWTEEEVIAIESSGNEAVNAIYEETLGCHVKYNLERLSGTEEEKARDQFTQDKYKGLKFSSIGGLKLVQVGDQDEDLESSFRQPLQELTPGCYGSDSFMDRLMVKSMSAAGLAVPVSPMPPSPEDLGYGDDEPESDMDVPNAEELGYGDDSVAVEYNVAQELARRAVSGGRGTARGRCRPRRSIGNGPRQRSLSRSERSASSRSLMSRSERRRGSNSSRSERSHSPGAKRRSAVVRTESPLSLGGGTSERRKSRRGSKSSHSSMSSLEKKCKRRDKGAALGEESQPDNEEEEELFYDWSTASRQRTGKRMEDGEGKSQKKKKKRPKDEKSKTRSRSRDPMEDESEKPKRRSGSKDRTKKCTERSFGKNKKSKRRDQDESLDSYLKSKRRDQDESLDSSGKSGSIVSKSSRRSHKSKHRSKSGDEMSVESRKRRSKSKDCPMDKSERRKKRSESRDPSSSKSKDRSKSRKRLPEENDKATAPPPNRRSSINPSLLSLCGLQLAEDLDQSITDESNKRSTKRSKSKSSGKSVCTSEIKKTLKKSRTLRRTKSCDHDESPVRKKKKKISRSKSLTPEHIRPAKPTKLKPKRSKSRDHTPYASLANSFAIAV